MKKAQISIFVILAGILLLLTIIIFAFYFNSDEDNREFLNIGLIGNNNEIENFKDAVERCINLQTTSSTQAILLNGGYYSYPTYFANPDGFSRIAYYIINSEDVSPTIDIIEQELEIKLSEDIEICANQIVNNYIDAYESIEFNDAKVNVRILNSSISVDLTLPTTLKTIEGGVISLSDYSSKTESDLMENYKVVQKYLSYHNNDYTSIPVSKLSELSQKYNFSYIMQPLNYETVIYTFQFLDDNQDIKSTYKFAIEYNWED